MSSYRILKMESITSAPVLITGRSSRRLTASVVAVVLCPTSLAIFSTGTPCSLMIGTKVRRSARGHQFMPIPAASQTLRKARLTWEGVERRADRRCEHQTVILPECTCQEPVPPFA